MWRTLRGVFLEKKDPKKKLERRQRRQKSSKSNTKSRPDEISGKSEPAKSRYVASEISERVFARANYRCQFCGSGGTRCRTRTGLEIEHVRPFAMFPSHDERYLRVFCEAHNRWAAERVYGAEFIQRKIAERRRWCASRAR